jgi:hypothetical protein
MARLAIVVLSQVKVLALMILDPEFKAIYSL